MASWEIVSRTKWGADPPKTKNSLQHPILYVKTIALSEYAPCITPDECASTVKKIQTDDFKVNYLQDIRSNFLIGDDGKVYEGRGWFSQPPAHRSPQFSGRYMEIAHIGGRPDARPSVAFLEAKKKLIEFGIQKKLLTDPPASI